MRPELKEQLIKSGIKIKEIEVLQLEVEKIVGKHKEVEYTDRVVGLVEYRDGTVIDVIRQIKV